MSIEMENMWGAMKKAHYQRTLEQLSAKIRDAADPDAAMSAALELVVSTAHAQAGTLWYYDRFGDDRIHPRAVSGGASLANISLAPGEGIAGEVIQTGSACIIPDCQNDPRWAGKVDAKTGFRTLTMMCVPLAVGDVVFGSIQIINKTDKMPFDDTDLAFVSHLAEDAAALFRSHGLLEEYLKKAAAQEDPDLPPVKYVEVTFRQIFLAQDSREMAAMLASIPEFQDLSPGEQDSAQKAARELWRYFGGRTNRAGREKKWGFWK